jgi:hypothetical protein
MIHISSLKISFTKVDLYVRGISPSDELDHVDIDILLILLRNAKKQNQLLLCDFDVPTFRVVSI